ncbi:hypothetical protein F4824DRAFT_471844 [Ustulina deusta]|nr:hypothetical protein F4824DRAFT_471844 [Ustulina deusta]
MTKRGCHGMFGSLLRIIASSALAAHENSPTPSRRTTAVKQAKLIVVLFDIYSRMFKVFTTTRGYLQGSQLYCA